MAEILSFINREKELAYLEEQFSSQGAGFVVLYGRRRTGKTALIEEFIREKKAIYFMADKQVEKDLQKRFQLSIAGSLKDPLMERIDFASWDDLFDYWLARENFSGKVVMVLDEFQYLAKVNPAFPSILQRIWDQKLKEKNIFLIICGSLVNMMYATALSYESPLYGRRTGQMKLEPVSFDDCSGFWPGMDRVKMLEYYAITGGVPKYIQSMAPDKDLWENIMLHSLSKNSYLYVEPKFILNEEVTETLSYFSILKAIAGGEHKIGNIASKIGIQANVLTKYLDVLINLDVLERQVPVTEDMPEKSKMGLYFIKDFYFRFWFRYVFPYQSYLEIEETAYVMSVIRKDFPKFVGLAYERVCLGKIPVLARQGGLPFTPLKWGRWWTRNEEIDIVALNHETKEILAGECKWSERPVGTDVLRELEAKVERIGWNKGNRKEYFVLFSKEGFTRDLREKTAKRRNILLFEGV